MTSPKQPPPVRRLVTIRVSPEELTELHRRAHAAELNLNVYCRSMLGLPPRAPKTLLQVFTESGVDSEI